MSNKKKSKSKASESHKRGGRENSPRGQHNPPSPQRNNSITDQQGSENGGTGSGTDGIKLAARLFHNPLFSKRGFKHAKERLKSERTGDSISGVRCGGSICLFFYPWFLTGYSIAGFLYGDKNNSIHVFVYGSPLFVAVPYIIKYLNDVDTLLLSIFEIGEKNLLEYFADPGIRELLLTVFEIVGFIYQLVKGRQNYWIISLGMFGFNLYLVGNTLLIWERKKRPKPVMVDST
ncbi:ZYRO0C00220p [Zygosaccharomyces rouxii]|uniref:ZYRO0C00220p n=1 Tax=Zygosaccharomyces rouxii (strain ATCC 2623 / CBS 732 / NBRC 1130 / NCYC 568 / NRRL Y-229) TaxID=559307 RepID=C5DSH8_ZYGRC|nr:uncharacterized protein ZYRO0C00220g [Zygosaccharomyces rouxii]KAH9202074.1 hypothetical protein LQ764DRAFT_219427 [Zygosaccharomyces rouxii]CAR26739.1 ZYRO0C00220p [Zygosaccharomyces rouxii]